MNNMNNINDNINSKQEYGRNEFNTRLNLSQIEKVKCLKEIHSKLNKILYVYEKSMEPDSKYNYKVYCSGLALFISSSNILFGGELVTLVVNINSILTNDFEKKDIKRIVFESINYTEHLTTLYENAQFLNVGDVYGFGQHNHHD